MARARAGKRGRSFYTLAEILENPVAAAAGVCLELCEVAAVLHALLPASPRGEKAADTAALRAYLETFLNDTLPELTAKLWEAANFEPKVKLAIEPREETE